MSDRTLFACCRYWAERGADRCVACDAAEAAARGDIWKSHADVERARRRCGV